MKDCVYSSLREETLQLFSSIRTAIMGEVGGALIVVSAMFTVKAPLGSAALLLVSCGLVIFTTSLVQHWFLQALRQSTYLLFAHDLPMLMSQPPGELSDAWLLASRSESMYRREHRPSSGPQIHLGGDLERAIDQQFWLLGFATLATLINLRLASLYSAHQLSLVLLLLTPAAATAIFLLVRRRAVQSYAPAVSASWHSYFSYRRQRDLLYAQTLERS